MNSRFHFESGPGPHERARRLESGEIFVDSGATDDLDVLDLQLQAACPTSVWPAVPRIAMLRVADALSRPTEWRCRSTVRITRFLLPPKLVPTTRSIRLLQLATSALARPEDDPFLSAPISTHTSALVPDHRETAANTH